MKERARPPLLPSLLLGIGLGGFVDGIVLHHSAPSRAAIEADAGALDRLQ